MANINWKYPIRDHLQCFIADDPGLDFLNSIGTPAGTVIEWLANGEDLLAWLEQGKLIDSADAATIRANSFPGELDEVAAQARALREWFREFVLTHMGRPLIAKALGVQSRRGSARSPEASLDQMRVTTANVINHTLTSETTAECDAN